MDCPTDIVFVLDGSGSIGLSNFALMKSFLSRLVSRLDIDSGNTRVGLITYSSSVGSRFNLNDYSTVASVQSAISALTYPSGGTNTGGALAYVRTTMLTSAAGDRGNVPNVVAVLTDGQSNDASYTQVYKQFSCYLLHNKRILIFWVSMSGICNVISKPFNTNWLLTVVA